MKAKDIDEVQRVLRLVIGCLGKAFSFEKLTLFVEAQRNKTLLLKQGKTPVAITGYCAALQDVDLVVTRRGLDGILTRAAQLHEIAHLLLGHVKPSTLTYKEFENHPELKHVVHLAHRTVYDDRLEHDAEMFATLLLDCIMREGVLLPEFARDLHG